MTKRRDFLRTAVVAGLGVPLARSSSLLRWREPALSISAPLLEPAKGETLITVLHTNDTHSQIDPILENDKTYAGKGGVARRATLVKRIRKENPNTLLIDAGDVLQGTPYFNFYKGEVEYKAMSLIGYDAGTIGNHEFDNGVESLARALEFANFEIVSTNYDVRGSALEKKVKTHVVKTVGGIRVGLFGMGNEGAQVRDGSVPCKRIFAVRVHPKGQLLQDCIERRGIVSFKSRLKRADELLTKRCDFLKGAVARFNHSGLRHRADECLESGVGGE